MVDKAARVKKQAGETVADRQKRFLEVFKTALSDTKACENSGISRATLYSWLRNDAQFALAYEDTAQDRARWLESRVFSLLEWALEPENYKETLHHPSLVQSTLRGAMPEKYGDKTSLGADDAKRLVEELMKMKDDPAPVEGETESLNQQIDDILRI